MCNFRKIKAFTLIEALMSLLLLGLVCLLFQTGVRQLRHLQNYTVTNQQEDFTVFLLQLRNELKNFIPDRPISTPNIIYFTDTAGSAGNVQLYSSIIRINYKGGHHPLLMNVRAWDVTEEANGWTIEVTFTDEQKEAGFISWPTPY